MRLKLALIVMLLLSGCVGTTNSAEAICSIPLPTVSLQDTDQTIIEVDLFSERFRRACNG
jgi:hypothetical protein